MYTYVSMETMTTAETAGVMIVHVLVADDTRTLIIILHRGGEEDWGNCHRGWRSFLQHKQRNMTNVQIVSTS